ncbi:DUF4435 domain-containing protein [Rummeliibacillus pycnus]|uniref:DUF4435 domain-containing protein n=1 Tax=Rummeliibacillus pycnus TaxID=101070 RepID=UPI003D287BC5
MRKINSVGGTEEILGAVLAESQNFGFQIEEKILIVEGSDDIQAIRKYYFHKDKQLPFRVVKAEDLNENVSGKKTALKAFDRHKARIPNLFCLLDRDFDFIIGKNREESRIFYYDYYELENYLFEEKILRLMISRFFDANEVNYNNILSEFSKIAKIYKHFSHLGAIREICYHEEQEDLLGIKLAMLAKSNLISILENKSNDYLGLSNIERVEKYLNIELSHISTNLAEVYELFKEKEVASTTLTTTDESLEFFRTFISSKFVLKSIVFLMKFCIENVTFNRRGEKSSLESDLKNEWIPTQSEKFAEIMQKIESL